MPYLPILVILVPLVCALTVSFLEHPPPALVCALGALYSAFTIYLMVKTADGLIYQLGGKSGLAFVVDGASAYMVTILGIISLAVILHSALSACFSKPKEYGLLFLLIAALTGTCLAGDLLSLLIFIELSAVSTFALAGVPARRYLFLGGFGTLLRVLGASLLYMKTKTLNLAVIALEIGNEPQLFSRATLVLLVLGFLVKVVQVPLYSLSNNETPTPVGAVLSALYIKVIIYALSRIMFTIYSVEQSTISLMIYASLALIFVGGISALLEKKIKRILTFSTISQLGYITFALGLGSHAGLAAAYFHIANHASIKAGLYLATDLPKKVRSVPLAPFVFGLFALALVGLPPLSGFSSKVVLAFAGTSRISLPYLLVIPVGSVLTLLYLLSPAHEVGNETLTSGYSRFTLAAFLVLLVPVLLHGLFPDHLLNHSLRAADALLNQAAYIRLVLGEVVA